jgi:WD40 repeat protein
LTFTHWRKSILGLAFSAGGDVLGGIDNSGRMTFWDAKTGESKGELDALCEGMRGIAPPSSGSAVAFSPGGRLFAVGGDSTYLSRGTPAYQIRVFEADGRLVWEHVGRGDLVTSLAFSPDGRTLAQSGPVRGRLRLWDVATGDLKRVLEPGRTGVLSAAFSTDGKLLAAVGGYDVGASAPVSLTRVTIWDAATGEKMRTLDGPAGGAAALAFLPGSHEIACGGTGRERVGDRAQSGSEATLWDADSGALRWTWKGSGVGVQSLAFAPDGKSLAVCNGDELSVIDAASGRTARILARSSRSREPR